MNYLNLCLSIVAAALVSVSSQIVKPGKCPPVDVVQNLDVEKYLGDWYEIQKFFFVIELEESCIRANYSLKADGHIRVFNRGIEPNGNEKSAEGDAVAEDANVKAKLSVEFNGSPRVPYWIVDTDYDTYSLVWSCQSYFNLFNTEFSWILSRQRTLDPAILKKLEDKMASYKIDISKYKPTKQTDCPQ